MTLPAGLPSAPGLISSQAQTEQNSETVMRTIWRLLARSTGSLISVAFLLLFGVFSSSGQAPTLAAAWNQLSPATSPTGRYFTAVAYDATHGNVVLFGGITTGGTFQNDTWLWNGTNWTNVTANPVNSTNTPPARGGAAMAYDAAHGQVVLFGGRSSGNSDLGDTWIWNGTTWTQASPLNNPGARNNMSMVFDAAQGNVVLFGGDVTANSGLASNDTWTWNGSNWTQQSPATVTPTRDSYSMAYDAAHGQVVMFGGSDEFGDTLNDTWLWNGSNWTEASPSTMPSARYGAGMDYDAALGQVLMFGGVGSGYLNETWTWDGTNWTQQTPTSAPSAREVPGGLVYDPTQGQVVMFGGFNGGLPAETWTFSTPQNFGNVNVCPSGGSGQPPCNNTMTLVFNFAASSTTVGSVKVLTQGISNLDFTIENTGSNCGGNIWNAGTSCTVAVTFTPQAPGLREGAVELFDNSSPANLLVTAPIFGVGQGSVAVFSPLSTLVASAGLLTGPKGVLVDAAGDLFVSDYDGEKVVEVGPTTTDQVVTIAQSPQLRNPQGLGMDGAGNLYVADVNIPGVMEIPWGCIVTGSSTCQRMVPNPLNLTGQFGVSADARGDVFVSAYNQGEVVEVPANGGAQTVVYTGTTPIGTVEDAAGDLFVADSNGLSVVKVPAGCTNTGCYVTIGSNWTSPNSVSLDAAGDLYVVDGATNQDVVEFPAGCITNSCAMIIASPSFPSLGSGFAPYDAVTDAQGNVYIGDYGNKRVDEILQQFASLTFSQTPEGSRSGDSPESVLFQNIGNQALTAAAPGLVFTDTTDYLQVPGSGTPPDCTSTFSLAPGAACDLSVNFQPESGNLQDNGAAQFTDNAVFNNGQQSIALSGSVTPGSVNFTLTVTASGSGSGAVTDNAESLSCTIANGIATGTCSKSYPGGNIVTLIATPNASTFVGWGGACASYGTSLQCAVTMNAAENVSVTFAPLAAGDTIAVTTQGPGGGAVTSNPAGINCTQTAGGTSSGACSNNFTAGSQLTLTATPTPGSVFAGWGSPCSGNSPTCTLTVNNTYDVGAYFAVPSFGSVNVGSSSTFQVTFSPTLSETGTAVEVQQQGGNISDFSVLSGGSCVSTVTAGTYCNATIKFTPVAPGLRMGAVELVGGGQILATEQIYGIGMAPLAVFTPATQIPVQTTSSYLLSAPRGVAVDNAGDVFITDSGNARVIEVASNGNVSTVPGTFTFPESVAVDGVGDIFVADGGASQVVEISAIGTQSVVYGGAGANPTGVAVDGVGDLFIADSGKTEVIEIPVNSTTQNVVYNQGTGSDPIGVAVDGSGNLYVADKGLEEVFEVPPNGGSPALVLNLQPRPNPVGVAVDAAGDLYVADDLLGVLEVPAGSGCSNMNCVTTLISNGAYGVAVDSKGDVFAALPGYNEVLELEQSVPPSLNFGESPQGIQVGPDPVTIQNVGNLTLTGGVGSVATTNFLEDASSTCNSSFSLSPGASCIEAFDFRPESATFLSDQAIVSDNSLNGSATQTIALSGVEQQPNSYTLTVTESGSGGTVASNPTVINCTVSNGSVSGLCELPYPAGNTVPLTATPAAGSVFAGWGGACASYGTTPTCLVSMLGAETVSATFSQQPVPVGVCAGGNPSACNGIGFQVTFTLPTTTTISSIQVVTQGATGLDFQLGGGGTCDGTIPAGNSCNVNVRFTPTAPGLRMGAVELLNNGSIVATQMISGIGQGPAVAFTPATQTTVGSGLGLQQPEGVAVDAAGDVYISDYVLGKVFEVTPGGVQSTIPASGLANPYGVAVDGAGNVFIADPNNERVVKVPYLGNGNYGPQTTVGSVTIPYGVAADGAGNVYIVDSEIDGVVKVTPSGVQSTAASFGNASNPYNVAVDAAGDLFVSEPGTPPQVVEVTPGGTQTTIPISGLPCPYGVAVDAAGDVYVSDPCVAQVVEVTPGGLQTTVASSGLTSPITVAVDPAGNLFLGSENAVPVVKINASQGPTLSFGTVAVNGRSNDIGVTIQNVGNQTLTGSVGSPSNANFANDLINSTCTSVNGISLTAASTCVLGIYAQPTTTGSVSSTVTVSDNSFNATSATQTIGLQATGSSAGINYALMVSPIGSGNGTVTDNTGVISCIGSNGSASGTCTASYQAGLLVTLTANPAPGSVFLGWGGACTGFATCQVSMTGAESVTASFALENYGSINVCQPGQSTPAPCNESIPVTINVPTSTTIGAVQVVTQGATGLDFTLASGGTCTGTIAGGTACTVNVQFAPLAPGLRLGAVELFDTNGNVIASTPIYGNGQAPAAAFNPAGQVVLNTGSYSFKNPNGVLLDAAGDLFIGDTTNQRVVEIAANGSATTVGVNLQYPQGLAMDGAGDLFIADNNLNEIVEVPAGCTSGGCQKVIGSGLRSQIAVAVDAVGDVFYTDYLDGLVAEVPANGGAQSTVYSGGPGSNTTGITVDSAGDLFFSDYGLQKVVEIPAGGGQKTVGTGWVRPETVSVDAAGDVYVEDIGLAGGTGALVEVPNGCTSAACQITLATGTASLAATVDAGGDVFIANNTTGQITEIVRSLPPALNFALTNVNNQSADSPKIVSVQNVGNQNLMIAGVSNPSTTSFSEIPSGSTCSTVADTPVTVTPGASCVESFSFTPQNAGILSDSSIFSDNSLNLATSVSIQAVDLNGIGSSSGATGTVVPNVVGKPEATAAAILTAAGLNLANVSSQYSSSEPSGSVAGENPAAGTQVNLGTGINLVISTGQAPAPAPNPLTFENNYFVTGDFATAGLSLRGKGSAATNTASGTITIPDSTSGGVQGVPDGADIVDGFLYWETLENTATASGGTGTFLGYSITGQQVGVDVPYTDGALSGTLRVYRADVNNYFQSPAAFNGERLGSGPFAITLPDSGGGGFPLNEGASMVVIYRVLVPPTVTGGNQPSYPLKSVVIYDGAAIPTAGTNQTVNGFYDAFGNNGELAVLYSTGGNWNGTPTSVPLAAHASSYSVNLNSNSAYAAVIFSTQVTNSDNDGILDAWKNGPAAPDFFAGEPGYYDVRTQSWVALPGAKHGQKDLFVQLDYMCGNVDTNGDCTGENLFPSPDPNGNDPLAMVTQAFQQSGIALHLEVGNAVPETTCTDTPGQQLCQFPGEPGVIGWKNSLEFSKVWPRNYDSCLTGGDCTARFPYGQKDSYHYVLFGHSLAIPAWNSRFGSLVSITTNSPANGQTTITTTSRGAPGDLNYCPSRFTLSGILSQPSINGVYNTASCPDAQTIILTTPGVTTWSYSNNNPPEPDIGLTSGTVTSISGYSDLGGQDSAVSLALWETSPTENMATRANVVAGTLFHEIGHTIGLSHGGIYYQGGLGSYIPTFDINCKPNYQSSMNYLFQLVGVGPNGAVAYSNQTLETLTEGNLGGVTNLVDVNQNPATYSTSSWYQSTLPDGSSETQATMHCDGTPTNPGEAGYFVSNHSVSPVTPGWQANQNITFDGQQPGSTGLPGLVGYNDIANLDLRQVGATGGEFASLASVLSFGNSSAPVSVASGSSLQVGAGGTITVGTGGSVSLNHGGNLTVGTGALINSNSPITFVTGTNLTFGSTTTNNTVTPGTSGFITLPIGGNFTLNNNGTVTMPTGGTVGIAATSSTTSVTVTGSGTISGVSGVTGTVTIPAAGGTFTLGTSGGTITLNNNGSVSLSSGLSVTLGGSGTVTMGGAGNVTMGGAGVVTINSGGTVTMGGAGNATLSEGGNVTMGGAGSVTLANGGTVTMGGAGNVTMGGAGTVTMGGAGDLTVGSGANLALPAGGAVTVGVGGTITMGGAGNVTMGGAGSVTFGALGGNVTMGGAGNVTMGGAGTVTMGGAGGLTFGAQGGTITMGPAGNVTMGGAGQITLGPLGGTINGVTEPGNYTANESAGTIIGFGALGGTVTMGGAGNVTMGGAGTVTMGGAGSVSFGVLGGTVTMGGAGTVTMGGAGNVTMGGAGSITMTLGGTITMGGAGNVTMGGAGVVSLGGTSSSITLGGGGNYSLSSSGGGTVTMGGAGASTKEMDYGTANSVVRPPVAPTYQQAGNSYQVNWTAPAFGVVQTYTISRSVLDSNNNVVDPSTVIGSVSGVIVPPATTPNAPATTFTDTNPPAVPTNGKLIYTITTTLVPDTTGATPRQSAPSAPAVVTVNQTIVLGQLPSSVVLANTPPTTITVTATAQTNNAANMQVVSFSASGPCSAGSSSIDANGVSSATVTLSSTGSCTVTASQAGDSTTATTSPAYSAATPVSGTFMILPQGSTTQSQSITFGPLPSVQYGNTGFSVSASSTSGLPVSFTALANPPCTIGTATMTGNGVWTASGTVTGAGLCKITASSPAGTMSGNSYSAASVTQSFYITAAPLTVAAINLSSAYGQPLPSLTPSLNVNYTLTGFVNGDTASVVNGVPALSTTVAPGSNAGTYPNAIVVSTGTLAAANYSFIYSNGTLTITSAGSTTAPASQTATYSSSSQAVALSASVTSTAGTVNTGTVTFTVLNNGTTVGTATTSGTVTNGTAGVNYTLPAGTAPGPYTIRAAYSGSTDFGLSSGTNTLTISAAGSTTTAAAQTATYSSSSQAVALSATVTNKTGATISGGTVTFTVLTSGGTTVGTATVSGAVANGAASVNYTLPAGTALGSYTIQAVYNGSTDYTGSSGTNTLTISTATTTTAPAALSATYNSGSQVVALSASVTSKTGGIVSAGTVTFTVLKSGGSTVGTATTSGTVSSGTASVNYTLPAGTALGSYTIQAVYTGSTDYTGSSGTNTLTISTATTTTAPAAQSATYNSGSQVVALSASVTSKTGGTVSGGTVTFTVLNGGTTVGSATISGTVTSGAAQVNYTLPAGTAPATYTIQAVYNGSTDYTGSSGTNTLTISAAATTTTAAAESATYSSSNQAVTLSASVTSKTGGTVSAGTVTFTVLNGGTTVGTATTSGTVSSGTAQVSYTLPAGTAPATYTIQAVYNGSTGYTGSSGTNTLTVKFTATAPASGTSCNGAYSGTFNGNLTVTKGQSCTFIGGGTTGTITETGGNLALNGSTVVGGVTITGGTFSIVSSTTLKSTLVVQNLPSGATTSQVCGSTITGSVAFQKNQAPVIFGSVSNCAGNVLKSTVAILSNTAAVTLDGNNITGGVQVQSNSGTTTTDSNTIGGGLQIQSNTGAAQVFTNIITGSLQCQSNSSITGSGNKASSKTGQCATF